jgi:PadR family transcriptional regulator PadR
MIEPPEEATGTGAGPGTGPRTDPGTDPSTQASTGADFGTDRGAEAPVDPEALERKFQRELNAGLVSLVLLSVLEQAGGELYGYQIAKQLQQDGGRVALIKQGALYPVLRTMSANGLLASRVEPSLSGPPRRYYQITPAGREVLARWGGIWRDTRDFVDRFAGGAAVAAAIAAAIS